MNMKLLLAIVFLGLTACSATQTSKPSNQSEAFALRQQDLKALENWRLSGKLGFKLPRQSGSAFIDWRQNKNSFRLHLSGPLGQGAMTINSDGKHHTVRKDGKEIETASAQDYFQQQFGWELPIQQLRYWALGIPAPGEAKTSINPQNGLLDELKQDRWHIRYLRYSRHRQPLPEKIILQRQQIKLTLIIHQWT